LTGGRSVETSWRESRLLDPLVVVFWLVAGANVGVKVELIAKDSERLSWVSIKD